MSQENVEVMRQLIQATGNPDLVAAWTAASELLAPEIEMDTTRAPIPGLTGVYQGPGEVVRFWREWVEAWGSLGQIGDPVLIDAGDQVFAWFTQHELRGKGSGIGVEMPEYAWVVTVCDSKIVEATLYMDKTEALEAAGLAE